jgi:hypothetical protein
MAKEKSRAEGSDMRPGKDAQFYTTPGGIITPVAQFANDITGTPPNVGYRGGPREDGRIPTEGNAGENPIFKKFFKNEVY